MMTEIGSICKAADLMNFNLVFSTGVLIMHATGAGFAQHQEVRVLVMRARMEKIFKIIKKN